MRLLIIKVPEIIARISACIAVWYLHLFTAMADIFTLFGRWLGGFMSHERTKLNRNKRGDRLWLLLLLAALLHTVDTRSTLVTKCWSTNIGKCCKGSVAHSTRGLLGGHWFTKGIYICFNYKPSPSTRLPGLMEMMINLHYVQYIQPDSSVRAFSDLPDLKYLKNRKKTFTVPKYLELKHKKWNTHLIPTIYCKIKAAHLDILHENFFFDWILNKKNSSTGRLEWIPQERLQTALLQELKALMGTSNQGASR